MRNTGVRLAPALAALVSVAAGLMAQSTHVTPFTGTWILNVAKSKFDPGPPFRSFTIVFSPDGVRHLDLVDAEGQSLKVSLPWSDGKEVPVMGMENATATSKIEGRTIHDIWKQDGKTIEDVHGEVSATGKIFTTTVDATDKQGRAVHNRLTFERQ